MPQHEKTVQPSKEEAAQTEPFQKTRDLAANQINQAIVDETNANPSLAGTNLPKEDQAEETTDKQEETTSELDSDQKSEQDYEGEDPDNKSSKKKA